MANYIEFYNRMSAPFRSHPSSIKMLRLLDYAFTGIMYFSYPLLLLYLNAYHHELLLKTILVPAITFVLLSLFRDWFNAPRPYENPEFHALFQKDTIGHSMPSRHIFSSALISMCFFQINHNLAVTFLIITALNAILRVIAGVHYPKDVIAGMLVGIACALLLFL